ncbi:hypothetical protein LEP1GSC133_2028 [Leptospira borgpetersenii serovar Pomona str. 200901868]|uniref:Uncharacterized protein n=1 Tax=Leptospira borgpetersenii serovar Pomona str. 200901868 TaxID=1192866 RepID=M6VWE9_LEPBO|nr:hypothetical protein LEP1GSC133_2028 [Leptospira borgpetersenii serovar Pomona str. 200901868]
MGDLKNMRKKIYCSGWGANQSVSQNVGTIAAIREDSDKIE